MSLEPQLVTLEQTVNSHNRVVAQVGPMLDELKNG
jgi:hypothetical protein